LRYLVVSDIHGNREALEAVLNDARGKYERIVSCGDLCDYGPDSNFTVDWARIHVSAGIRGNHDRICAGLGSTESFAPLAQEAAVWTMEQLTPANRTYLCELPGGPVIVDDDLILVHGSPRDEDEYVIGMDDVSGAFASMDGLNSEKLPVFFGHTHLQWGFVRTVRPRGRGELLRGISGPLTPLPETLIRLDAGGSYLINPGSVGQPRDGDPRAGYALFDSGLHEVRLRRVHYDHRVTERKIVEAGLPTRLGSRLAVGR
jgi:predicted phosphodiesterase